MTTLSRRTMLKSIATGTGALAVGSPVTNGIGGTFSTGEGESCKWTGAITPKVRVICVGMAKGVQKWPNVDYDPIEGTKILREKFSTIPNMNFTGFDVVTTGDEAKEIGKRLGDEDGVLLCALASAPMGYPQMITWDKPTIIYNFLYQGCTSFLSGIDALKTARAKVVLLSSSRDEDLLEKLHLFRVIKNLKETKVLLFRDRNLPGLDFYQNAKTKLGVEIKPMGHEPLNEAFNAVSPAEAEKEADRWIREARAVLEPSRQDIVTSSRFYLGLRKLMEEERAKASTIDCLGLFYAKALPAFPCLAFVRLNDIGLTGVCESDINATLTQILIGYLGNRPGYVSDPVIDTSNDTVIHAHCVAATQLAGPNGQRDPYIIRNHAEDRKGASLQVLMPVGQVITSAKFVPFDKMLISTGEIIGNVEIDLGCRTKITTKVNDATKMMEGYSGGLHRVIFYGDWVKQTRDLGKLLGFSLVEEC